MAASFKNVCTASCGITCTDYYILRRKQTTCLRSGFKLAQFKSIPP